MSAPEKTVLLAAAAPLIEAGLAIHWLQPKGKAPVEKNWTEVPVHTAQSLRAAYRADQNMGVRPGEPSRTAAGYLHILDVDIRDPDKADEAWAIVDTLWPGHGSAPTVISGSGGRSRHLYFFTERPCRSRKLAHSAGFSMVFDAKKERDVKKFDWEIDLLGSGKQAVLPPSIHPDTGKPYVWAREIDFDMLEMCVGAVIPASLVAAWGVKTDDFDTDDEDDLFALVRSSPMGLTEDEIAATLRDLPVEWVDDRDQWFQVGMALHHEYEGRAAGFERWSEWSKRSVKYDAKDQARVWKSFKGNPRDPVRMATLIKAAGKNRDRRDQAWMDEFDEPSDDLADLLGGVLPAQSLVVQPSKTDSLSDLDLLLGGGAEKPIAAPSEGLGEVDPDWRDYFHRNEKGEVKPSIHNTELIVRHDPRMRGIVAFNEFTMEIVLIKQPKRREKRKRGADKPVRQLDGPIWRVTDPVNGDLWSDSHDNAMRLVIETPKSQGGYELKTSDRDLHAALDVVAQKQRFHPVRAYLEGLAWDLSPRVERLWVDYVGSPDDEYHREAALLFMVGAVARIFEPGHKFDFVPILEGLQGKRKSTFIRVLGRHWFSELQGDFHDTKAMVEAMQGAWILEIPELQGFSKAEVTTIKSFCSLQSDKVRMAYAKRSTVFKRQCVFMGSTNEDEYLRDQTGGRRFWPILCLVDDIDTDRLEREVDQMWAEAVSMYREWRRLNPHGGLPLFMRNPVAAAEAKRLQESRRQERTEDSLTGEIEEWLNSPIDQGIDDDPTNPVYRNEVCLKQLWVEFMGRDRFNYPDRDQQWLGRAMLKVEGWSKGGSKRLPKYGKQRVFVRDVAL